MRKLMRESCAETIRKLEKWWLRSGLPLDPLDISNIAATLNYLERDAPIIKSSCTVTKEEKEVQKACLKDNFEEYIKGKLIQNLARELEKNCYFETEEFTSMNVVVYTVEIQVLAP